MLFDTLVSTIKKERHEKISKIWEFYKSIYSLDLLNPIPVLFTIIHVLILGIIVLLTIIIKG